MWRNTIFEDITSRGKLLVVQNYAILRDRFGVFMRMPSTSSQPAGYLKADDGKKLRELKTPSHDDINPCDGHYTQPKLSAVKKMKVCAEAFSHRRIHKMSWSKHFFNNKLLVVMMIIATLTQRTGGIETPPDDEMMVAAASNVRKLWFWHYSMHFWHFYLCFL